MEAKQEVGGWRLDRAAPSHERAFAKRENLALLLGALALILVLRLVALLLNATDLYMDEAQYWAWAQQPAAGYYSKPPLIAWIIHGATSLCGDGEACVRLPSTLLHILTALLVYAAGTRLYDSRTGIYSALAYALLPAVSLSSGIISTDVPLLAAWALALYAFAGLLAAPTWSGTALLALALGVGLNAKYAMAYFVLCAAVYFAVVPQARERLSQMHLWLALAGGVAPLVPNILWNRANAFATVTHTADNADWTSVPFHPLKAAEFLLSQFGVFGPILFAAFAVIVWRALRDGKQLRDADKLLLAFSAPILLIVTAQAFASRAHANWAAPAYIAAVVLVTSVMLRDRAYGWMRGSFALHAAVAIALAIATWQAGRLALPVAGDPFARTLGNRALADTVRAELTRNSSVGSVLTDSRDHAAALAYYGRDLPRPVRAWRAGPTPRSHFELTQPFDAETPLPALLVTSRSKPALLRNFATVVPLGSRTVAAGSHTVRTLHFFKLSDFQRR